MSRLLFVLCTFLFVVAERPTAGDDQAAELSAQVNRLVRQLDSDRLALREAAERELIQLGPAILDLLPTDSQRMSADQKTRLQRVCNKLQVTMAEETTKPSLVTLAGEMSFAAALTAIEQQTGNRIGGIRDRQIDVKVAFEETPFWPALDQLLDQAELDLQADHGQGGLALSARPPEQRDRSGAARYDGVFRFEPLQITGLRNLRTPEVNGLQVALRVTWEPRASVVSLKLPAGELHATDDREESLAAEGRLPTLVAEVDGQNTIDLNLRLRLPSRDAKRIAVLRGKIEATVLGRNQKFEFARLDETKDAEQSQAGATVVFEQIRKNQQLYEVRMRVRFDDAADSLESHRDWISRNKAYIIDGSGKPIQPAAEESFLRADNQVGRAYLFNLEDGPVGCRFIYETPGVVVRKTFAFEFENVDLP